MKLSHQPITQSTLLRMLCLWALLIPISVDAQVISSDPPLPTDDSAVTILFNAAGTPLEGFTGDVYAHTGVLVRGNSQWQHVIGNWPNNTTQPKLTRLGPNSYSLLITPSIREFYNVPSDRVIEKLAFVFRAPTGTPQSADLFIDVFEATKLNVSIISPSKDQPIVEPGASFEVSVAAIQSSNITLFVNNQQVSTTSSDQIQYTFNTTTYGTGTHWIKAVATGTDGTVADSVYVFVRPQPPVTDLPDGVKPGINYINNTTVTLVKHDPPGLKKYAFVIGDFNDWMVSEAGYMNRTPAGDYFWITLSELTPDTEYGFQYFIDNELRLADPYTHKILDPWNDPWIPAFNYPNLKPYPTGKTNGIVSIMHPGRPAFNWQATNFTPPAKEDMVIYELLIRDFVGTSAIKTITDTLDYLQRLGVNVIELMPINEFEGNISWGYNPSFYFASDKAYGTREDYKRFIDECHKRGIAVVLDIVLNHAFNLSPHVQMYFDKDAGPWGRPTAQNPWFLQTCPHEPWCWGNTFDQNSVHVHELFNRITEYWLTEFNVDGFRFDFTKGFTNRQTGNQGSDYDAARIANLKRIANHVWSVKPNAYVILEHLTANNEEKELAEYGMMLWGNMNHQYLEASMGWLPQSNFSGVSYKNRGWNVPHLIAYMESHDEERMMFKNLQFGRSAADYDVKEFDVAIRRAELATTFYIPIPGPKMIWQFGELGYDFSINHCPDGSINDRCRTDPKPVRWDYYNDSRRKRLFDVYSILIDLKKNHDVFRTTDYTLSLAGAGKRIHLNHASNNVTIIGNFDVTPITINPNFQRTGTWHEFFTRRTLQVSNITDPITLAPGEYRMYSTVAFPDHGLSFTDGDDDNLPTDRPEVFPNPSEYGFNFRMKTEHTFHLRIVNLQGQTVFERSDAISPTNSSFFWDKSLSSGSRANTGIYIYRLASPEQTYSGRIIVW